MFLGGWPVAVTDWQPPPFPLEILLGKIKGTLNEGVLIEQWVGPDDKNSSVNIIQVRKKSKKAPRPKANSIKSCGFFIFLVSIVKWVLYLQETY